MCDWREYSFLVFPFGEGFSPFYDGHAPHALLPPIPEHILLSILVIFFCGQCGSVGMLATHPNHSLSLCVRVCVCVCVCRIMWGNLVGMFLLRRNCPRQPGPHCLWLGERTSPAFFLSSSRGKRREWGVAWFSLLVESGESRDSFTVRHFCFLHVTSLRTLFFFLCGCSRRFIFSPFRTCRPLSRTSCRPGERR